MVNFKYTSLCICTLLTMGDALQKAEAGQTLYSLLLQLKRNCPSVSIRLLRLAQRTKLLRLVIK